MLARFRNLSIRNKLHVILMGTSAVSVFLISLALYLVITNLYRISYENDLGNLARVIGDNCEAALSFDVREDAQQVLQSLRIRDSVIGAFVYDHNGDLFSHYLREEALILPEDFKKFPPPRLSSSAGIAISQDIIVDNAVIGRISLQDDMHSFRYFRRLAILFQAGAVLAAMFITFILADRLQSLISNPITSLAALSRRVSEEKNFSLRATPFGSDEVGGLVESFNAMLSQIETTNCAILDSEKRFRTLLEQGVDAFFLHDIYGNILDVNQETCQSLGYSRDELLTKTVEDIDSRAFNDEYREKYWSVMKPDQPVTIESEHRRKDGSVFPVEVRIGTLELGGKKIFMALARDITIRKKAERDKIALEIKLQQAQKMESIGTLAGGIAHDFNNILTPIFGYLELARDRVKKLREEPELAEYLDEVSLASGRARDLVRQILTFSRQESEDRSYLQIHLVVREALKFLRSSIPTTIEIRESIDKQSGFVLANPTQIHQVLMNLCTNAYQAMRETGGVLGVSLMPFKVSNDDLSNPALRPGEYVHLEVSDTGHGMDKETLEKAFEPYFTTKIQGEGTGMGLSVVHGIVKGHGGHITVYSEPGRGATFHVYLPAVDTTVDREEDLDQKIPTGTEHILVVDDEASVVNLSRQMLNSLGYRVTTFLRPQEALQAVLKDPQAFDLVITDMTMPKMTGYELAQKLLAARKDLPIIMCTGFSELINEQKAKEAGIKEYIMKPFSIKVMSRAMHRALGKEIISS